MPIILASSSGALVRAEPAIFECSQGYLATPWFLVWTQVIALRCLTATFHVGFFDHEVKWVWLHWRMHAHAHVSIIHNSCHARVCLIGSGGDHPDILSDQH